MGSIEVSSQINSDRDVLGFDDFSIYDRRDTVANAHCSESFVLFESICLQSTFERRYLLAKGKEERKKT